MLRACCGRFVDGKRFSAILIEELSERQKRESRALRGFLVWWAHTDLNRGPKDYESSALTN